MYEDLVAGNRMLRGFSAAIGAWVLLSSFLWPHTPAQRASTFVAGLLCIAFSLLAMAFPPARWLNTAVAIWLIVSMWFLPHDSLTTETSNTVAGVAMFLFSVFAGPVERRPMPHRVPA